QYSISSSSSHKRIRVGVESIKATTKGDDDDDDDDDDDQEMEDVNDNHQRVVQKLGKRTAFDESDDDDNNNNDEEENPTFGSLLSKIDQFKTSSLGKGGKKSGSGRIVSSVNDAASSAVAAASSAVAAAEATSATAPPPSSSLQDGGGGGGGSSSSTGGTRTTKKQQRVEVKLSSVLQLREEIRKQGHPILTPIFANHTFVGTVDNKRALIQNELALYLVHYEAISEELFYQICLRDFSNFGHIRLLTPAPIKELILMALEDEQELMEQKDGLLSAIPMMIKGYIPNLEKLPDFLWRMGSEVDWTAEKACFQTLSRELAIFYSTQPERIQDSLTEEEEEDEKEENHVDDNNENRGGGHTHKSPQEIQDSQFQHMVKALIFPAFKKQFIPPKALIENSGMVVQIAQVKDLYKVFERC
ncbi:DNA mismatch repair protein, partial [Modicella reniformis]